MGFVEARVVSAKRWLGGRIHTYVAVTAETYRRLRNYAGFSIILNAKIIDTAA